MGMGLISWLGVHEMDLISMAGVHEVELVIWASVHAWGSDRLDLCS